jgi:hypothetical protein
LGVIYQQSTSTEVSGGVGDKEGGESGEANSKEAEETSQARRRPIFDGRMGD